MSVQLMTEEAVLVSKFRKEERPTYYSANFQKRTPISEDMEAFIILAPPKTCQEVINWTNNITKNSDSNADRNNLLSECLQYDSGNADAQMAELDSTLANYDNFRDNYFRDVIPSISPENKRERFYVVPEVGQVLADLELTMEELSLQRDRAKHLKVLTGVLIQTLAQKNISKDQKNEINSWAGPFSTYMKNASSNVPTGTPRR